ncbi:hypothetical protein CRENBAI_006312, partial [Crenichthys baileyi]
GGTTPVAVQGTPPPPRKFKRRVNPTAHKSRERNQGGFTTPNLPLRSFLNPLGDFSLGNVWQDGGDPEVLLPRQYVPIEGPVFASPPNPGRAAWPHGTVSRLWSPPASHSRKKTPSSFESTPFTAESPTYGPALGAHITTDAEKNMAIGPMSQHPPVFCPKALRELELKIPGRGSARRFPADPHYARGPLASLPGSLLQRTNPPRWDQWRVSPSLPPRVSKTCGRRSDDTTKKSIIDLLPRVSW